MFGDGLGGCGGYVFYMQVCEYDVGDDVCECDVVCECWVFFEECDVVCGCGDWQYCVEYVGEVVWYVLDVFYLQLE